MEWQKPKNERRALPQQSLDFEDLKTGKISMDEFNEISYKTFNDKALVACEICGWTFLPDSLKHHVKAC